MAEPKESVVSFETARTLQEKGVIIDSVFSWGYEIIVEEPLLDFADSRRFNLQMPQYPAPNADEIWNILPDHLKIKNSIYFLEAGKYGSDAYAMYAYTEDIDIAYRADKESLREALADLAMILKKAELL